MQNAKSLATVERERERERESCSLKAIAILACKNTEISLLTSKLNIIYCSIKVDMQLLRKKTA